MLSFHEDLTPVQLADDEDGVGFVPVLRISGELDIATAPQVHEPLLGAARTGEPPWLLVDLTELTFCGSAGLAELLGAQQTAARHGGRVVLVGCRPEMRRLLRLAGVDDLFLLAHTLSEAVASTVRHQLPRARDAAEHGGPMGEIDPNELADPDHR